MPLVLASAFGDDTGGGLFRLDGGRLEQLDHLSSTGLAVGESRLVRLLRSSDTGYGGELLLYDERGVKRYLRIDGLTDPHGAAFDEDTLVVVSTSTNSVLWLSEAGEVVRRWKAPGAGDAWHLNSLAWSGGRLIVCAFGRFVSHRQWAAEETRGTGFLLDLESGEEVLGGLWCPHDPHPVEGGWILCNSAAREVAEYDVHGKVGRRTALRGWTRGLAVSDDFLFVGESATRKPGGAYGEAAGIVVVDRASWEVVERIPLPCREIYDLALVPPSIVEGVRTGFRTNPLRVGERDQADMFAEVGVRPARLWATGDPLPAEACRIDIEADVPDELPAGSMLNVECVVENRGSAILVSAPPRPVHVSYRWEPGDGVPEGVRSVLPEALPPGLRRISRFALATPDTPGDYVLRVTLVQEQVRWFDELDPTNAWSQPVRIRPVG